MSEQDIKLIKQFLLYREYLSQVGRTEAEEILRRSNNLLRLVANAYTQVESYSKMGRPVQMGVITTALKECKRVINRDRVIAYRNELIRTDFMRGASKQSLANKYGITSMTVRTALGG